MSIIPFLVCLGLAYAVLVSSPIAESQCYLEQSDLSRQWDACTNEEVN